MSRPGKQHIAVVMKVFLIVILFTGCTQQRDSAEVKQGTVASKQVERPALPTMLELGSEGCIPCEKMKPVMAQLTEDYGEKIHIEFHDVKKEQEIAKDYRVRLIPTQVFLKADGTEFFRHEGFFAKDEIVQVFRDMGVDL